MLHQRTFSSLAPWLFVLACSMPGILLAQQDPQFTQFRFQPFTFNPAAAGTEPGFDLTAIARMQWVGLTGAPQSQALSGHLPLYGLSSGVGFSVWNDVAGLARNTGFYAAYAYHVELGRRSVLSIGVSAGGIQYSLDGNRIRTPEGSYEDGIIDHNDNVLPLVRTQSMAFDVGLGLWFQRDGFRAGVSTTHLLEPDVTMDLGNGTSSIRMARHYYVTAAQEFTLTRNLALEPGVQVKQGTNATALDANLLLYIRGNMWTGVAFRTNLANGSDAVGGMLGTAIGGKFRIGYAYDYTLSALNQVAGGSHEVFLGYRIAVEKPRSGKRINNPRYLQY